MSTDFNALRRALPYIRTFKDKIFVVKLGGDLCEDNKIISSILEQVMLLHVLGIKIILVHGGGKHATALGAQLGVHSEFVAGRRVTTKEMLEVIKMSFAGVLHTDVLAKGKKMELPLVGLSGIDGDLITAVKREPVDVIDSQSGRVKSLDYGYVAEIVSVNTEVLTHLVNGGYIPVICSLASDSEGQVLNINADRVASKIAATITAEKLCYLGTTDGVLSNIKDPSTLYSHLSIQEAKHLIETGIAVEGMIPKLTESCYALDNGVKSVHVISGVKPDAILEEIFTNEGSGTMIVQ